MAFPRRPKQHVHETASVRRLQSALPDHWIIRQVTERDYGVDCIVEFVTVVGDMPGHMVAVQLKSVKALEWAPGDQGNESTIGGIKTATVKYWSGIPLPVFLAVHERETNKVYFAPVNRMLRRNFRRYSDQKSISFELREEWELTTQNGLKAFAHEAFSQLHYRRFASALLDLLYGARHDADTLLNAVGRDSFMCVEIDVLACYVRVLRHSTAVAELARLNWPVRPLGFWMEIDSANSLDADCIIHQPAFDRAVADLAPHYAAVLNAGMDLVLHKERDYWEDADPMLLLYCESWQPEAALKPVQDLVTYTENWRRTTRADTV